MYSVFVALPVTIPDAELKEIVLEASGEWFYDQGYIEGREARIFVAVMSDPDYLYRQSQLRFIKLCLGYDVKSTIVIDVGQGKRSEELAKHFATEKLVARFGGFVDDDRIPFKQLIHSLALAK